MSQIQVFLCVHILEHPSQDSWANGKNLFGCTFQLSFEPLQSILKADTVCREGVAHCVMKITDTTHDILDVSIAT